MSSDMSTCWNFHFWHLTGCSKKAPGRYATWLLESRLHQTVERNWQNRAAGGTNAGIFVWTEKGFHRHSLSASVSPPKKSCALFFQLYTALCLICPHLIHLPPIFLSPLQGAIPLEGEGTISSPWVDNPLSAHLQGIMQATSLPTCSVVAIWSA